MESCLTILYRGPLASCNYACSYCPFAKQRDSARELAVDRRNLERFVSWVAQRKSRQHAVFFTPWGEALIRPWYRTALVRLSHLEHVRRVTAQTNLSYSLEWLAEADRSRIALWCTYHPEQVKRNHFVDKCLTLLQLGIRFSVGVVGTRRHIGEIESLRRELPASIYLWVNAYRQIESGYTPYELDLLTSIDPLFPLNVDPHASFGEECRTGATVISVDGDGDIRRCHFIPGVLGNIYTSHFEQSLRPRHCTDETCHCHIGYVHLSRLKLDEVFGANVLERIPLAFPNGSPVCSLSRPPKSSAP